MIIHKQIFVKGERDIFGNWFDDFECDEEIVELITLLNKCGIKTIMSCQSNIHESPVERVWINIYLTDLSKNNCFDKS